MKDFVNSLMVMQKYMLDHDNIRTISVARNGIIKIVFDHEIMSENDCRRRMEEYGISEYEMAADWHSNSIFITVKP